MPAFGQNATVNIGVDAAASHLAISPMIYGAAWPASTDWAALNLPIARAGGEAQTGYNWQIDATNLCQDWYFESYPNANANPDGSYDDFVNGGKPVGTQSMLTVPITPWLANLGPNRAILPSFSVKKYGAQTGVDPYDTDAGNGVLASTGKDITGNSPTDAYVPNSLAIQQAWLQHLISTFGAAANGGVKYYVMDNEPSIWSSVHRDVHPTPETYSELYNDYVTYASAVRAADPNAVIVGPEEWGWWAEFLDGLDQANGTGSGSDYATHNNTYYYPWLLQQLAAYQKSTGTQLLNVLSTHYYPAELSNSNDDSASGQATRNASTRALWDPNYVDPSWLNQVGIDGGIVQLIPHLKSWVSQYYPGLQTAITEYNWGDEANLNGATTQADVLGIFGKYGLDIGTRWTVPANPSPTYLSMEIYRNYDGKDSTFGNTSVSDTVPDPDFLSSYAAVRSSDGALTLMVINKQTGSTPINVSLANFANTGTAQAWQISSATQTSITQIASVSIANNTLSTTVPSQSITLFIISAGSVETAPLAPTGLSGYSNGGKVILSWNASGGATSYNVQRSTTHGGPYTSVATVTSPSTAYTDSSVTVGSTYYYVVSGADSAGSGPNSAEASVKVTNAPPPPTGLSATGGNAQVALTWTASTGATSYDVYRGTTSGGESSTPIATGVTSTSYTDKTAANGTTYYYTVAGVNASGVGGVSNEASAEPVLPTTFVEKTTASPLTVTAGQTINFSIKVTATGAANSSILTDLEIYNSSSTKVNQQFTSGQAYTQGGSQTNTFTWTPTTTGTYTVNVGVFSGDWSVDYVYDQDVATLTVNAVNSSPPAAPTGLTAKAGGS